MEPVSRLELATATREYVAIGPSQCRVTLTGPLLEEPRVLGYTWPGMAAAEVRANLDAFVASLASGPAVPLTQALLAQAPRFARNDDGSVTVTVGSRTAVGDGACLEDACESAARQLLLGE